MAQENEEQTEKRKKKKLKWQIKLVLFITLFILATYIIGTKGVFIKEYKIETNKIESGMHGLKITQFSDVHYGAPVNSKKIDIMVKKINETKPDIVIFTGDLIDEDHKITNDEKDELIKKLSGVNAELGKYYVVGEEDFDDATSILNLSGFLNLNNGEQLIYNNTKNPILLIGKENVKQYFETNQTSPWFKILALHNPSDLNKLIEYNFDMVVAGHTHNGQINIPKFKDLLISGKYKNSYQKINETKLFINPGIGTSGINVRMFNHPTIYLFRLYKTATNN